MMTEQHHGRHELPPESAPRRGRSQAVFGVLAVLLCLLLGVAIATQVRQTDSGDSLDSARPADLLVLLDSLQQREAALNTEVADLQRTLTQLEASGSSDQAAIAETVALVEHKMSLVMGLADRILVLGAGKILEDGERAALARDPRSHYAQLLSAGKEELEEVLA